MFNPEFFLNIAKWLITIEDKVNETKKEAVFRTIIGRAYYAAFLKTNEFLNKKGLLLPTDSSAHAVARENLKIYFGRDASDEFKELRQMRICADYKLDKSIRKKDAQNAINLSESILSFIELFE
ncbi:MAG: HEPN domain-containing protein [Methanosarcinales archaeon]